MRLYQAGALLTGARNELIRHAGVLVDGTQIVAAGPLDALAAGHPPPADVLDLGEVTLMPGLVDAGVDTIEHCSFAGADRKYGSDFDPAVVEELAAAGIYVCPTMNVHALTMRDRFGDALEKVIMGLYSGGAQIIAGTDAGIGNCPHGRVRLRSGGAGHGGPARRRDPGRRDAAGRPGAPGSAARRTTPVRPGGRAGVTGRVQPPMTALADSLNAITVAELRRRGGLKWTYAGPDVLGAFVAEMDFGTAPAVEDALREVIARRDYGYLTPLAAQQMAEACAAWLARARLGRGPGLDPPAPRRHQGPRGRDHPLLPPGEPRDPAHPRLHAVPDRAAAPGPEDHPGADDHRRRPGRARPGRHRRRLPGGRSPAHPVQPLQPRGPRVHRGRAGWPERGR